MPWVALQVQLVGRCNYIQFENDAKLDMCMHFLVNEKLLFMRLWFNLVFLQFVVFLGHLTHLFHFFIAPCLQYRCGLYGEFTMSAPEMVNTARHNLKSNIVKKTLKPKLCRIPVQGSQAKNFLDRRGLGKQCHSFLFPDFRMEWDSS